MLRASEMAKAVPGTSLGMGLDLKGLDFLNIMINQFSSKDKNTEGLLQCHETSYCNLWLVLSEKIPQTQKWDNLCQPFISTVPHPPGYSPMQQWELRRPSHPALILSFVMAHCTALSYNKSRQLFLSKQVPWKLQATGVKQTRQKNLTFDLAHADVILETSFLVTGHLHHYESRIHFPRTGFHVVNWFYSRNLVHEVLPLVYLHGCKQVRTSFREVNCSQQKHSPRLMQKWVGF